MRKAVREILEKEEFAPGLIGMFVNPFYFARRELHAAIASFAPHITGKVLDVGCGRKPYARLFRASEYVGIEVDTPNNRRSKQADFYYEAGAAFPFENAEFDNLLCSQVLEHVFAPSGFLKEAGRVLKPGGMLLLTVPFVWDEHEQPFDYARYSSFGLRHLLASAGFEIVAHKKTLPDVRVIAQLCNAYLFKTMSCANMYWRLVLTVLIMSPFNIMGSVLYRILPRNEDLFLDNVVLARKVP